jgi:phage-related protein
VDYTIAYYSEEVQKNILALPDTLAARYIVLTRRMVSLGPNLGEPHTKVFGGGLFELRLKGAARHCPRVLLHCYRSADCHVAQLPEEIRKDTAS